DVMEREGSAMLDAARIPREQQSLLRRADVRYRRQAYELTVPIPPGPVTAATLAAMAAAFHAAHEQTYGHANQGEPVQLVNLRLTALGRLPTMRLIQPAEAARARTRQRAIWFPETGFVSCPVHWREGLVAGTRLDGPAIVESMDSTCVVPPGWRAVVDEQGFIFMRRY
ncbi:MAG: hydantoinase/oxoprolinase family protein, partial [Alphaproteobacteria bacterium]|nr:hydantoinase/oxoprolinase family protein [Alphaproteobacteria bacterium]